MALSLDELTSKAKAKTVSGCDALLGYFRLRGTATLSMVMGQCQPFVRMCCWIGYHPKHVGDRQRSRQNVGLIHAPD